jgi:ATP-dependent Lhr-like helicase
MERFFDESGGMQLVIHTPFGSRSTAPGAWRCASASAAPSTSSCRPRPPRTRSCCRCPPATAFRSTRWHATCTRPRRCDVLVQALLDAPLFGVRWRWNATTALALPRFSGGRKVAPQLQRMKSEDLLAAVFPDQVACAREHRRRARDARASAGRADARRLPARRDGCRRLARAAAPHGGRRGEVVARDLPAPSPLAMPRCSTRGPTPSSTMRRWRSAARRPCRTGATPIRRAPTTWAARCRRHRQRARRSLAACRAAATKCTRRWACWPAVTRRRGGIACDWKKWLDGAGQGGPRDACARATRARAHGARPVGRGRTPAAAGGHRARPPMQPAIESPADAERPRTATRAARAAALAPRRLRPGHGGATCRAAVLPLARDDGRICWRSCRPKAASCRAASRRAPRPSNGASATCSRASTATRSSGCAARSNRWSRATSRASCSTGSTSARPRACVGPEALSGVLSQLEGYEAPAPIWEAELLPARVADYAGAWLDDLCTAGRVLWTRLRPSGKRRPQGRGQPVVARHAGGAAAAPQRRAVDRAGAGAGRRRHAGLPRHACGRAPAAARRLLLRRDRARHAAAAGRDRRGADRTGGQGPRALRQLRRPARACWCRPRSALRPTRVGAAARRCSASRMRGAGPWCGRRLRWASRPTRAGGRGARAGGPCIAAPLRCDLLAPARTRGRMAAALARAGARVPAAGSARRDPRRPLHRGPDGRAVRAARSGGAMRQVRRTAGRWRLDRAGGQRPGQPAGHSRARPKVPRVAGSRVLYRDGLPIATSIAGEVALLVPLDAAEAQAAQRALTLGLVPDQTISVGV